MQSRKAFTLLEVIIVIAIFFIFLAVVFQLYFRTTGNRTIIQAKQTVVQEMYYTINNLHMRFADFTIDYEEYYNRSILGCTTSILYDTGTNSLGYCDIFTYYGNATSVPNATTTDHAIYYCSSSQSQTTPEYVIQQANMSEGVDCYIPASSLLATPAYQSFGQYKRHFRDVRNNADTKPSIVDDIDDEIIGLGPMARSGTQQPELYMISHDQTQRLYIRRVLVDSGDWNQDGTITGESEYRYTLQMLRLRGLDAGSTHNFDLNATGVLDGQIDTRVCDTSFGFICSGDSPGAAYAEFYMPADENDGRVDILSDNITITERSIYLTPHHDPYIAIMESDSLVNPTVTMTIQAHIYGKNWQNHPDPNSVSMRMQHTFTIKQNYVQP